MIQIIDHLNDAVTLQEPKLQRVYLQPKSPMENSRKRDNCAIISVS